ncbi:MAG: 5-oxoprolinase subunit PxpA [Armatimonadota bacterium]|nr:5-oxoprolinase subunit PxpA [Armatimonadota bacterium]MDR7485445.1 5-oxoprolinase subunit PxpA [Armatimonadota bacterium]MDR7534372.1 5-oxoprolinase subunit PxpA [Armatimonadota bacterium]MDR7536837.1 5-oxoprolinase subunit PxpA [Armatimonadota bacterium]
MSAIIDLNADGGEGFGAYTIGADEALLASVTSLNVACGYHGGDPVVIRRTIRAAAARGVSVGAHPGFPDLQGFGRRAMQIPPGDLTDMLIYQIGAVAALAAAEGARLRHVKAHGALYNLAERDDAVAGAIAAAAAAFPGLWLYAPPGSPMARAAQARGVRVAPEGFLDRGYRADGTLVPRSHPDALLTDPARVAVKAVRLAAEGVVEATDGTLVALRPRTLCVHSDTPGAPALAAAARAALERAGVRLAPPED